MAPEEPLDKMARSTLVRRLIGPVPTIALVLVLAAAAVMLSAAAQHSALFSRYYSALLLANVAGIIVLAALILANLYRLRRQYRAGVLGSRLTLRLLGMFVVLALIPLAVVYYFSVQFLNRGIDSWFDVRIEQALDDALLLGRASLEAIKQDRVREVEDMAARLVDVESSREAVRLLDEMREQAGFAEMTLFTQGGRVIAWSSADPEALLPSQPPEALFSKPRQGVPHVNLEPLAEGALVLRILVPVYPLSVSQPLRLLQVVQPLPLRYAKLGESVQSAFAEYERLVYLRGPLKFSFIVTLTLVTLVTLLLAVWAAMFVSRRLAAPLRDLAEGTRAVAAGDYRKQLPVSSSDELGVLVQSFNDMTRQIHQAQTEVRRSHREAEAQRTYLETVLAHLSSGVLSFDLHHRLRTLNATAAQILGIDLASSKGKTPKEIAAREQRLQPLFHAILDGIKKGAPEWQCEVTLAGERGRKILICRGTRLPAPQGRRSAGYVVVFDDVTALIQAQRDAAWGEVARRLAHEIKNPLTPIQLSAERIRHKYLSRLQGAEREALDRATRTIAEQVESLKSMVNAFSSYAQPKQMQLEPVELNQLVQDVIELHKDSAIRLRVDLDPEVPRMLADRGRLRQVLNNLLVNARDALKGAARARLTVRTRRLVEVGAEYVEITVADNGPGFPAELMDRLFEPYVTTKGKGSGLGLAIVKRIVDEHGGTLWAQNLPRGGAAVTVSLPVRRADAAAAAAGGAKERIA